MNQLLCPMKVPVYPNNYIRLTISLFASFFIVLNGRWHLITKAFQSPSFYVAVAISFGISYLMLTIIHRGTTALDRRAPWHKSISRRTLLQLLIGLIFPIVVDIALAAIYITATGQNFVDSGFLLHDFPIIAGFVILMNLFYLVMYLTAAPPNGDGAILTDSDPNNSPQKPASDTEQTENRDEQDETLDILYCCRMGRRTTIYTANGRELPTYQSLSSLLEMYSANGLIQINRSTLINVAIVEKYDRGHKRDTLQLLLKDEYVHLANYQNMDLFVVTKDHIDDFLGIYDVAV